MRLDEYVSIDNKIARSVNLERDAADIEQIRRFQITPMVQRMLGRFADALEGEPVPAWSLTGPYGSGKSAFCNYLLALCSNHADSIRETAFAGLMKHTMRQPIHMGVSCHYTTLHSGLDCNA
jgi:hypothetical protein